MQSSTQRTTAQGSAVEQKEDKGSQAAQPKPFPLHGIIIAQFKGGWDLGLKAVQSFLGHASTSSLSKLQLMARLLDEVDEKAALLIVKSLPNTSQQFCKELAQLSLPTSEKLNNFIQFLLDKKLLPALAKDDLYGMIKELAQRSLQAPEKLNGFIEFLLAKKLLPALSKKALYSLLIGSYHEREAVNGEIYFTKLFLALASLSPQERHTQLCNLAGSLIQDENEALAYSDEIFHLEKSGKLDAAYFLQNNIVAVLLRKFQKQSNTNFRGVNLFSLQRAIRFAPDNPEVLRAFNAFVNELIQRAQPDPKGYLYLLIDAFNLVISFPKVADFTPNARPKVISDLLQLILEIPENQCEFIQKFRCCLAAHELDKALALATAAKQTNPADKLVLYSRAEALHRQSKFPEALEEYLEFLRCQDALDEEKSVVYSQIAHIHYILKNHVRAIQYADMAVTLNPNNVNAYGIRIYAYAGRDEMAKAKSLLWAAKEKFPNHKLLATIQGALFPQAVSLETDPNIGLERLSGEVDYHIRRGELEIAKKKIVLLHEKDSLEADVYMAHICIYEKNYGEALKYLEAVTGYKNVPYYFMVTYYNLDRYAEAEEQAWIILLSKEASSKRDKQERMFAYQTIANIYLGAGAYAQGFQRLTLAFDQQEMPLLEQQYLHYLLFNLAFMAGDLVLAEEHAYQATQILPKEKSSPGASFFLLQLGRIYVYNMKLDLAIVALGKSLKMRPDNTEALFYLGYAYYKQGSAFHQEALRVFSQLLALAPLYLMELARITPELMEKLQPDQALSTPAAGVIETETASTRAVTKAASDSADLLPEIKEAAAPVISLSHEQLIHRQFQADKKQQLAFEKLQLDEDQELAEEKSIPRWELPDSQGFISMSDPGVVKVALGSHSKETSQLYAYLPPSLKEKCDPLVYSKWQNLIAEGRVVGKKNQQGLRLLNDKESEKLTAKLGAGYVIKAKLKVLGFFGDERVYAAALPSTRDEGKTLLLFDKFRKKTH